VAGLDVERLVWRAISRGHDTGLMARSLALRVLPDPGPRSWLRDRARFLRTVTLSPLRRLRGAEPLENRVAVYDPAAPSARFREYRRFFVRHHFGTGVDFVGRGCYRVPAAGRPGRSAGWYARGVLAGLGALLDWSPRRYAWLGGVFLDIQAYLRAAPGLERVYLFGLYDRRPYVMATFLHEHTDLEVYVVFQNIPLYRNCRYFHLPVPVVLTSKVNLAEVEHYRAEGHFKASEVLYRGQEYLLDTIDLEPGEPRYDIGFFSSGEWARRGGLYQCDDAEAIRRGDHLGNPYHVASEAAIEALAEYARERGRTLVIYPHPLERELMARHRIDPPWARLVDGGRVFLDGSGESSRSKVYECRVAVTLQSSSMWERLDLGLRDSFVYEFGDPEMDSFSRESLGEYAENLYRDTAELIAKVDAALSRG